MVTDEDRNVGAVTWQSYASFVASCGYSGTSVLLVIAIVFTLGQCAMVAADYFVSYWSGGSISQVSEATCLVIFVAIVAGAVITGVLRAVVFTEVCVRASTMVHNVNLLKVILAPVPTFFDVTPIGRILNRFSRDLDQLDNPLPFFGLGLLVLAMVMLSVFVVCAVTTPTTLVLYVPLLYVSHRIQQYYLAVSRELKRLDGVTRSPFLNLLSETLDGIETIRAFAMTGAFAQRARNVLDHNAAFFFLFQISAVWFAMRLNWVVTSVVAVVSFTCVAMKDSIGAASVGLALTYAIQLSTQFQRVITLASMTENIMTSFERIAHYGSLPAEGHSKYEAIAPPQDWPSQGAIDVSNVYLRYRDGLENVLRGVSFSIKPGEKIGICGRTGSGKSTLIQSLFRVVETSSGSISIDGVNIATVAIRTLRSRMTIIPQDPVLFSGSLRSNLDPFNQYTDADLFRVLRDVQLMSDIEKWGGGLSYEITEKGTNLSVGQRQLVCIARALLRDSRIVVLDEATASVDQQLDRAVQDALKRYFVGRTVLVIAHRLETIQDSDRVLVLDRGVVAEFATPAELLGMRAGISTII